MSQRFRTMSLMNMCSLHSQALHPLTPCCSHANTPDDAGGHPAMMADMDEVKVVVAHNERDAARRRRVLEDRR
jgi:hypothetical protein